MHYIGAAVQPAFFTLAARPSETMGFYSFRMFPRGYPMCVFLGAAVGSQW